MKDSELRMIETMLKKQDELNSAIMKEFGLTTISKEQIDMATLDEIGEFTHELKGDWCWWKKTQPKVDREKVLGELVDIWHFVLSLENNFNYNYRRLFSKDYFIEDVKDVLWSLENNKGMIVQRFTQLTHYPVRKVETLIAITEYLGFTIEDVYKAYCDKNKVNYQRLESGY